MQSLEKIKTIIGEENANFHAEYSNGLEVITVCAAKSAEKLITQKVLKELKRQNFEIEETKTTHIFLPTEEIRVTIKILTARDYESLARKRKVANIAMCVQDVRYHLMSAEMSFGVTRTKGYLSKVVSTETEEEWEEIYEEVKRVFDKAEKFLANIREETKGI